MAAKKRRKSKKKPAEPKKSAPRAYRVDSWSTGVKGAGGLQLDKPGWTMRGTYAARKLATAHRKMLERTERVSTRIVSVAG
jgi:hypothetical protein